VRVIAGSHRGRRIRVVPPGGTRPTSDRVREAVFDVLGSLVDLEATTVVDLFAGSGAMGIEALSRGAATAVFVDQAPAAVRAVRENLAALDLSARARVVQDDVLRFVEHADAVDLALCDPPYAFSSWALLLGRLRATLAVLESADPPELPATWETVREKRYGGTLVTVVRPLGDPQKGTR
jgi:16S rRNA (guanine966-N2)-methyltransferase